MKNNKPNEMPAPAWVNEGRLNIGLSQQQLADRVNKILNTSNMSQQRISNIEKGKAKMTPNEFYAFSKIFKSPPSPPKEVQQPPVSNNYGWMWAIVIILCIYANLR